MNVTDVSNPTDDSEADATHSDSLGSVENTNRESDSGHPVPALKIDSSSQDDRSDSKSDPALPTDRPTNAQPFSEQLIQIRRLIQTRLARYSQLEPGDCQEVYQLQENHFCGIRFVAGHFHAQWRISETVVSFFRGEHQIDQLMLDPTDTKRAA